MWISPLCSGTSRWITAGSSAPPEEYAVNAPSIASMHERMSRAARTSASRRIRTTEPAYPDPGSLSRLRRGRSWPEAPAIASRGQGAAVRIDLFQMERFQSLYWNEVEYDLSESGVMPLSVNELLGNDPRAEARLLETGLWYPLSEGSERFRERIAEWYPGAGVENVSVTNGGSEANHLTLWSLLRPRDRLAFMVPNYMQGWGLGRHYANGTDVFRLRLRKNGTGGTRWALDLDELEKSVTKRTRVIMVCNPNNPTGSILSE